MRRALREAADVLRFFLPAMLLLTACPPAPTSPEMRPRDPTCAVRDCATGKIIDNGCTADGRCETCVNFCKNGVAGAPTVPDASAAHDGGSAAQSH